MPHPHARRKRPVTHNPARVNQTPAAAPTHATTPPAPAKATTGTPQCHCGDCTPPEADRYDPLDAASAFPAAWVLLAALAGAVVALAQ